MTQPYFSIIIPTLNEARVLPNLLTQLSHQNFKSFEVIVVDAKSTDSTLEIARSFVPKLSLSAISSPQKNVSFQRNLGAQKAHSPWLLFLDADTQIPSHFLSQLITIIRQVPTHCFTCHIRPDTNRLLDHLTAFSVNFAYAISTKLRQPVALGACIGINRHLFNRIKGFDPNILYQEDVDLVRRVKKAGYRFRFFPQPKITYSFRRFRRQGYLKLINTAITLYIKNLLLGFHTASDPHVYPMKGGDYYTSPKSSSRS